MVVASVAAVVAEAAVAAEAVAVTEVCAQAQMHMNVNVEVREQLSGLGSLLTLCHMEIISLAWQALSPALRSLTKPF